MTDPLAGQRDKVNSGAKKRLVFPDQGKGCPVEVGQVFELKSCHIEITEIKRKLTEGEWRYEAEFTRYTSRGDPVRLLAKKGGYTSDPRQALSSGEERPKPAAGAKDVIGPPPEAQQAPPEPEAIDNWEVGSSAHDSQARALSERDQAEAKAEFDAQPVEVQLRQLSELAKRHHVDISSDVRVVKMRVEAMKRKVLKEAA